ncbi:MAG: ABC transporter permease subunit [Solirubrobacterales bacterium]|nr:ABC transporter permease subunit [Solirubrobacterales bacterium]
MSGRRAIYLTSRREVREGLRSRALIISTGIQVAIVVAIVIVAGITGGDETNEYDIGYVGSDAKAVVDEARSAASAFDAEVSPREYADPAAARAAVDGEDIDAAIAGRELIARTDPSDTLTSLLQSSSREVRGSEALRSRGLSEREIDAALEPPPLALVEVGEGSGGSRIAFIGSLLLYVAILSFGIAVATAVVVEKSTRVVEVILAAIRPVQLLTGKVLGIGLLGLCQVTLIAVAGIATALITGSVDLPDSTAGAAVLVVVYFLLGYLMYAAAFAVSGAIVSRQEDVQSASAPLTILLIAGYLVAISTIDSPDSTIAEISTFFPPLAPMVVPGRAAQGALPAWELAVSIVLMLAATVLLLWLAARIYDRVVLRMGAPLKLRQVLRLAR